MIAVPLTPGDGTKAKLRGTTSFDGFLAMVTRVPPKRPDQLTEAGLARLDAAARYAYDRARRAFHAGWGPVRYRQLDDNVAAAEAYLAATSDMPGIDGIGGMGFNGLGAQGKTTLLNQICRNDWNRRHEEARYDGDIGPDGLLVSNGASFVPICSVSLVGSVAPSQLLRSMARFFEFRPRQRARRDELEKDILGLFETHATDTLVVDEFHCLASANQSVADTSAMLKGLLNELGVRLIFAGIGIATLRGLYEGLPSDREILSQNARRLSLRDVPPVDRGEWRRVLATFDANTILANHDPGNRDTRRPGDLLGLADYLDKRTGRIMGALRRLHVLACATAMKTGCERITLPLLDSITLPRAIESDAGRIPTRSQGYLEEEAEF